MLRQFEKTPSVTSARTVQLLLVLADFDSVGVKTVKKKKKMQVLFVHRL